jgi:hypothetical protein
MPTLEVQLAKAQKSLAALEEVMKISHRWEVYGHYSWCRTRVDQQHGNDAELRGLRERVRYLHQRIAVRDERIAQDEQRAAAHALMRLALGQEQVEQGCPVRSGLEKECVEIHGVSLLE